MLGSVFIRRGTYEKDEANSPKSTTLPWKISLNLDQSSSNVPISLVYTPGHCTFELSYYPSAYDRICKHEFVFTAEPLKKQYGISALDIAKRLIDFNYHPPTIYFPLVVPEAMMFEPTETETKATLDEFAEVMIKIRKEMETNPDVFKNAPYSTPVSRLDEVKAVKEPKLVKK